MMEAMIPSQVGISLWTLQKIKEAKEAHQKKRKREKREKGQCYYPFSTLVLQSITVICMIESPYAVTFIY